MTKEFEEYKENIKSLARNRIDEIIYNSSEDHAAVILSELIENAENYVHIVCENMNRKVTDRYQYLDAVDQFLSNDKHHEIKILLTDYDKSFEESKIADVLRKHKEQVFVKYFEPKAKILSEDGFPVNWAVADDRAFRFEENTNEFMAFANFCDRSLAKELNESFNTFFNDENNKKVIF